MLLLTLFAVNTVAENAGVVKVVATKQTILNEFQPLFMNAAATSESYKNKDDLTAYNLVVQKQFEPYWDAQNLVSRLIGVEIFESLDVNSQADLVAAMENTLRRYAFENRKRYLKGRFSLVDAEHLEDEGYSSLSVLLVVPFFPDLKLKVFLNKTAEGKWKAYDLGFKGVTYIGIKKREYRRVLKRKGVQGLVNKLESKNKRYFKKICRKAKVINQKPCLEV